MSDTTSKGSSTNDSVSAWNYGLPLESRGKPGVHRLAHQPSKRAAHHEDRHKDAAWKVDCLRDRGREVLDENEEREAYVQIRPRRLA